MDQARHLVLTAEGRVRLVWRLLLWFGVSAFVGGVMGVLVSSWGLVATASGTLLGAWVAGAVTLSLDGRGPGAMGFYLSRSVPREASSGLALGVGLAVGVVGVLTLSGGLAWSRDPGTLGGWFGAGLGSLALLAIPAASEEALLRGYPLQALTEAWGPVWGLAFTSLAFGALHLANPGVTMIGAGTTAAAGLFLGAVYLRTGSLWWSTAVHLGWNWGIGFLADLPVSGLELIDAPLIAGSVHGPAWLSGGSFGPEGSVVALAGFASAAAVCWWGPWLGPEPSAMACDPLAPIGAVGLDRTVPASGPNA